MQEYWRHEWLFYLQETSRENIVPLPSKIHEKPIHKYTDLGVAFSESLEYLEDVVFVNVKL